MFLEQIGADARVRELFRSHAPAGTELGRISFASHEQYRVVLESAECDAASAGRLRWMAALPAVGDWVAARRVDSDLVLIEAVLPRRTQFSRHVAGRAITEQVIAANIDLAVIVCGLDGDFNLRRIERYLVLAREGGIVDAEHHVESGLIHANGGQGLRVVEIGHRVADINAFQADHRADVPGRALRDRPLLLAER